jgi:hypothetical protein
VGDAVGASVGMPHRGLLDASDVPHPEKAAHFCPLGERASLKLGQQPYLPEPLS